MAKSPIQKMIEAGVRFTDLQQEEARKLIRSLVKAGEVRKKDAESSLNAIIEQNKRAAARIATLVQQEVDKATDLLVDRLKDLEKRIDELGGKVDTANTAESSSSTEHEAENGPAPNPAKKTPAKKAPAKKTPAKKDLAKKAPAKKSPAKKAPSKKAPAKKSPAKKTPAKKAPAKKAVAKKAPAKKSPAKKAPAKRASSSGVAPINTANPNK